MPGEDVFGALESRRGQLERTRENTARLARSYVTHRTTGWGEILVAEPVLFRCTFYSAPAVTSGLVVESSVAGDDSPLIEGRYPRVTVGVWKWVQDVNDHYTGAYLFFAVETVGFQTVSGALPAGGDPGYRITHHLLFEGISYKDFNPAKMDY